MLWRKVNVVNAKAMKDKYSKKTKGYKGKRKAKKKTK